jgi:hypothetical protein
LYQAHFIWRTPTPHQPPEMQHALVVQGPGPCVSFVGPGHAKCRGVPLKRVAGGLGVTVAPIPGLFFLGSDGRVGADVRQLQPLAGNESGRRFQHRGSVMYDLCSSTALSQLLCVLSSL